MLNDPLVLRQAQHLAARLRERTADSSQQLALAFELLLGRAPSEDEAGLLLPYAKPHGAEKLVLLLFNTNEFMFID